MTKHEECCPDCKSEYLTKAMNRPVCCHFQIQEEFEEAFQNNKDWTVSLEVTHE